MRHSEAVVVGAGFAGVSTAYHLTRLGLRDVAVVEQEGMPGVHSSGRNAAIARQTGLPPSIAPLAAEGVRFLARPPDELRCPPLLRACGLLLLASGPDAEAWRRDEPERWLERDHVTRAVPPTRDGAFDGALRGTGDGVADIAALLESLLAAAAAGGARLLAGERVTAVHTRHGRVTGVETTSGTIETPCVVNAAGAWASAVGAMAGAAAVPLRPSRRHLFITTRLAWVDRRWPVVWDVTHGLYFRPEPPGLLLSPCDEEVHPPGMPTSDPAAAELLASKVAAFLPGLGNLPLYTSWAGLRTLTPDGRFVLGRDPDVEGFVWCAGLGGHGMTVSAAVGRVAAEAVLGRPTPSEHDPSRFASVSAA